MYVLGIDVGTTGTKALLLDKKGNTQAQGYGGYRLYSRGNRVEQEPEDWWEGCTAAVRQAVSSVKHGEVKAISLSAQGASMAAVDGDGKAIGRALTWMDSRTQKETEKLAGILGNDYMYHTTGWRLTPYADAPKILYMKTRKKYAGALQYLSTIDFINRKLTGKAVIDPSNAAIRMLLDIHTQKWDTKILDALGISEAELPALLKTGSYIGNLSARAAAELGLRETVKVYNGAHDQYCASLGSGAVEAGDMLVSTGTAWVIMAISRKPIFSDTFISPCPHPAAGLYGNLISLSAAGNSYQWIREKFLREMPFPEIDKEAVSHVEKNKALFFIPWLSGAGYPVWKSAARGGFIGMDFDTGPADMALAVLESAVFSVKTAIGDFEKNGFIPGRIKIMGGAARSDVWMELLAAVLDIPIFRMIVTDSCALGAAFIAARGEGWFEKYSDINNVMQKPERIFLKSADKNFYREKYQEYTRILKSMEQMY
jgi:sugar (pentulose or hexulose) kinase